VIVEMASTLVPLFVPMPGGMEMMVILMIAVLLFGANKIPKLARSTGQAMGEFQKGRQQVEQELQEMEETMDPDADMSGDDEYMDLEDEEMSTETETSTTDSTTTDSTSKDV
jgi:sec-independent protein translocase protein TatA